MGRWSEPEQSLQEERDRGTERSKGCFPDLFWVCACTSARTCWFPSAVFGTVAVFSALKREWEPQSWASQDGKTWTVKFFPLKLAAQLFFFFFLFISLPASICWLLLLFITWVWKVGVAVPLEVLMASDFPPTSSCSCYWWVSSSSTASLTTRGIPSPNFLLTPSSWVLVAPTGWLLQSSETVVQEQVCDGSFIVLTSRTSWHL